MPTERESPNGASVARVVLIAALVSIVAGFGALVFWPLDAVGVELGLCVSFVLITGGFLLVWVAGDQLSQAELATSKPQPTDQPDAPASNACSAATTGSEADTQPLCPFCGAACTHFICQGCKNIVARRRKTAWAVMFATHRAAILGALMTVPTAVLFNALWQKHDDARRTAAARAARSHDREERVTTQFSAFRAALTTFGADCVPRELRNEHVRARAGEAGKDEPNSATTPFVGGPARLFECRKLYTQIADGYVHWAWLFHVFVQDITHACVSRPRSDTIQGIDYVHFACSYLTCRNPMQPITCAYNRFTNAYADYVGGASNDIAALRDAYETFFLLTRRAGCLAVIAGYGATPEADYKDTTGTCEDDLEEIANDRVTEDNHGWCAKVLRADKYCFEVPSHPNANAAKTTRRVKPALQIKGWFSGPRAGEAGPAAGAK